MRKVLLTCFFLGVIIQFIFAQNNEHKEGGRFVKKIEYNFWAINYYNTSGKSEIEKLFFGEVNAPIEFFYTDDYIGYFGFRIIKDSISLSNSLEVKYISNYKEAVKKAEEMFPLKSTILAKFDPEYDMNLEQALKHNKKMRAKYLEVLPTLYMIETRYFQVNNFFAEELRKKTVSLIANFIAKGIPPFISGGNTFTFRAVVGDEVWSLWIHEPTGNALKMANLCKQIIKNAQTNQFDESMYMSILNTFEFENQ